MEDNQQLCDEVAKVIVLFFQCSLNWTGGDDQLDISSSNLPLIRANTSYLSDADGTEMFLIRKKEGQFGAGFVDAFRPRLVALVNEVITANNQWLVDTNYRDAHLRTDDIATLLDLTWSPVLPDNDEEPTGQCVGALAMFRASGNCVGRWNYLQSYRDSLLEGHSEEEVAEMMATKGPRGTGKQVPLLEITEGDNVLDEPWADKWVPCATTDDDSSEGWMKVVADGHWRTPLIEIELYDPADSCLCWKKSASVDELVGILGGKLMSPRTQRQLKRYNTLDATYVIVGTEVHLRMYADDKIILRECYALDADDVFFQEHKKRKWVHYYDDKLEEEQQDRAYGSEKCAIYERVLAEKISGGMSEYTAKEEAMEAAEKYDPEYDDDSAYGTDHSVEKDDEEEEEDELSSDGDMTVDYEVEEYERDADDKVVIMDVDTN